MDSYAAKFSSMQLFVPFLDKTIRKLERAGDKSRSKEEQLNKMKSLHGILTDPQKKVRLEVLEKCDEILRVIYEKVEGQPWPHGGDGEGRCSSTPRSPSPEPSAGWQGQGPGPPLRGSQVRRGAGLLGDGPEAPGHPHQRGGRPEPWTQQAPPQNRPWSEGQGPSGGYGPPMHRKDGHRHSRDDVGQGHIRDGAGPVWDGPGPGRDGPRFIRDGSEENRDGPGPMRDGPGPLRDGPLQLRDGFRPMRDGPGPMRDIPGPIRGGPGPFREGLGPLRDGPGRGPMRDGPGPIRHGSESMREGPMRDGGIWDGPRQGPPGRGPQHDGSWQGHAPWHDGPGSIRGGHRGMPESSQRGSYGRPDGYHRRIPPQGFQEQRHFPETNRDFPPDYPPDHSSDNPSHGRRQGMYHVDRVRGSNPRGGGPWQQAPFGRGRGPRNFDQDNRDHRGGSQGPGENQRRWQQGSDDSHGDQWNRSQSPGEDDCQMQTPQSPEPDTPQSPVHDTPLSPEMTSPPWSTKTKSVPMEAAPKSIPLERPAEKPRLSEAEKKNKLLSLKSKLEGKPAREFSPLLPLPLPSQTPLSPQEPDSQRSESHPVPNQTPTKTQRPPWTSPTDSPPSLSIVDCPMSPDTQTASPDQMPSPDTQSATPPQGSTSPVPDTPASPDVDAPGSPESEQLVILDMPSSPDTASSPSHGPKEIPTMPVSADSTKDELPPPIPVPQTSSATSRRDPRNRPKEPIKPPNPSPYAPLSSKGPPPIPKALQVPPPISKPPVLDEPPAYMSMVAPQQPQGPPPPRPPIQRPPTLLPPPTVRPLPSYAPPPPQLQTPPPVPQIHNQPPPRLQVQGSPQNSQPMRYPLMGNQRQTQMMPSQPRTFKEYRRIKEEQEKQRREYENNLRKEQEERRKRESEEKLATAKTEEDLEEKKEELPVLAFDDEDDVMTAKEMKEKRRAKLQKLAESKDPRKRKLVTGKEKGRDKEKEKKDDRAGEAMKSFKIPKVRKEQPTETKSQKPEKLAEIDLFKPQDIKNTSKADLTKSKKKIKLEKFITKAVKEDSSSDGDLPETVAPIPCEEDLDVQEKSGDAGSKTGSLDVNSMVATPAEITPALTDSDSEPGLTIAEEVERRISRESESENESNKAAPIVPAEGIDVASKELNMASADSVVAAEDADMASEEVEVVPSCSSRNIEFQTTEVVKKAEEEKSITREPSSDASQKAGHSKSDEESLSKSELTKELLKNIVSTLDPKKAKRLLEKASKMNQGVDKISLKDLQGLLSQDSSDSEEEEASLTKETRKRNRDQPATAEKKEKAVKRVKKSPKKMPPNVDQPAPGTRRSKRQVIKEDKEEEQEFPSENEPSSVLEEPVEDDQKANEVEDEEETFVIEPRVLKKRGRKRKAKQADIQFELDDEDLQDDFISSSGFIEQLQEPKDTKEDKKHIKEELVDVGPANVPFKNELHGVSSKVKEENLSQDIKLEPPPESPEEAISLEGRPDSGDGSLSGNKRTSVDALSPTPAPGMRQTRSMRSRMAPKSKTWFPANRGGTENKKSVFMDSALKSPPMMEVKEEETVVDYKVFLGEGLVKTEGFPEEKFEVNSGSVNSEKMDGLKHRQKSLHGIFDKLTKQSQEKVLAERQNPESKPSEIRRKEKLCSKIKLLRPPKPLVIEGPLPGKSNELPSLISRLSNLVQPEKERDEKLDLDNSGTNLLGLVQDLKKKGSGGGRRPPPALIPLATQPPRAITLLPEEEQRLSPTSACLTRTQLASQKNSESLEQLLLPTSLKHLFKCLLSSECSFTSDSAGEFLQHVHINHPGATRLQCGYCCGRLQDVARLVSHTIKKHGHNALQCSHCFHRSTSHLSLLLHQLVVHPALPRGFLSCRSLATSPQLPSPPVLDHLVQCPMQGCPHEFPPSALHLLPNHLTTHTAPHPAKVHDCSCIYCDFTSRSATKILLHQTLLHPHQSPKLRLRETDLLREGESDSTSTDEEEESLSDTESDLSEFDKHFYDEDIDTLDNLEKPQGEEEDDGLSEHHLYRCGNLGCLESTPTAAALREHLAFCDHKGSDQDYTCYHCHSEHKHIPGLLEHIKTHAAKRLTCSLCSFKTNVMVALKQHGRTEHKVTQLKFLPLKPNQTNPEEDPFVMVPKNTLAKTARSRHKEVFSPSDLNSIPIKPDIYKYLIRCSICDFSTKVKNNLVKHLHLHVKKEKLHAAGSLKEAILPALTPVNPPPILVREEEEGTNYKSLLPEDIDEELYRAPITDEEMAKMPVFVVENQRYACPSCAYITIDDVMLLDHISAVHPKMKTFACPHCPGLKLDFESVELHLRCHGDLLLKCGYCLYFHWQKRVAEAHVGSEHPTRKLFVKDVRANKEEKEKQATEKTEKESTDKNTVKEHLTVYDPFKCGLCDSAFETMEDIREHIKEQHGQMKQYKCSLCPLASDSKLEIEEHGKIKHPTSAPSVLKIFFIDPSKGNAEEEKREPLWSRDMEGLKHIRGILYEDGEELVKKKIHKTSSKREKKERKEENAFKKEETMPKKELQDSIDKSIDTFLEMDHSGMNIEDAESNEITKTELDFYPMQCKECGFSKKTVTGLKMHIKLNHLQVGKMQCRHCVFTANLKVSIYGHYRNKHPETITLEDGQEKIDYEERSSEAQTFSQDYWRQEWGIPTIEERRSALERSRSGGKARPEEKELLGEKKKKGKPGPKKGSKRKPRVSQGGGEESGSKELKMSTSSNLNSRISSRTDQDHLTLPGNPTPTIQVEQSPFEGQLSYMCTQCPKRTQRLDRMRQHVIEVHGEEGKGWQELSRDQVVSIITSDQYQDLSGGSADFKCFYCQHSGDVLTLKSHTSESHPGQVLRVVRFQAQRVTGYMECQLCGYLSPGFEKHLQNTHFHEEHPLESDVTCSKYMSKTKATGPEAFSSSQQAFKVCK